MNVNLLYLFEAKIKRNHAPMYSFDPVIYSTSILAVQRFNCSPAFGQVEGIAQEVHRSKSVIQESSSSISVQRSRSEPITLKGVAPPAESAYPTYPPSADSKEDATNEAQEESSNQPPHFTGEHVVSEVQSATLAGDAQARTSMFLKHLQNTRGRN